MSLIGLGATDAVYQLNPFVVVKRARTGEHEEIDHANEQKIFRYLEKCSFIPHLVHCYYQRSKDTFLEFAFNGCVAALFNQYQKRDNRCTQVLKISRTLNSQDVRRWMKQLCLAAAGLERVGLVHEDIRSGNMLLDADWNLKLSDFDRGMKIGDDVEVLIEPFGRLLNEEEFGDLGIYGKAGARTETFVIGSIYYTLLRGHELYETESWSKNHYVVLGEKFQRKEFSSLTDFAEDAIIRRCWSGEYQQVKEVLAEFTDDAEQDEPINKDKNCLNIRQMECKEFIQCGLMDTLERF